MHGNLRLPVRLDLGDRMQESLNLFYGPQRRMVLRLDLGQGGAKIPRWIEGRLLSRHGVPEARTDAPAPKRANRVRPSLLDLRQHGQDMSRAQRADRMR